MSMLRPPSATQSGTGNSSGTRRAVAGSWGLFSALGLLMLGSGLLGTLLGVRGVSEGFSTGVSGVILASYYVGFLAGSRYAVKAAAKVGHVRVFAALASLASTTALLHVLWVSPVGWAVLRFVSGFAIAGLYVVAEGWLNGLATNRSRGRVMAAYMIVIFLGLAASQLLLNLADVNGFELFILASVLVSLAVVPVSLSVGTAPRVESVPDPLTFRELWRIAPMGLLGAILVGATNGGFTSIGPVYAAEAGLSARDVSTFMTASMLGAVVLQFPLGYASDRMYRRRAILLVAAVVVALCVVATFIQPGDVWMLALIFVIGGLMYPLYSLIGSHVNDVVAPERALAAATAIVFYSGVGAVLGPLLLSFAIQLSGTIAFFWVLAMLHAAIALVALGRMATKKPVPIAKQRPWRALTRRSLVLAGTRASTLRP